MFTKIGSIAPMICQETERYGGSRGRCDSGAYRKCRVCFRFAKLKNANKQALQDAFLSFSNGLVDYTYNNRQCIRGCTVHIYKILYYIVKYLNVIYSSVFD